MATGWGIGTGITLLVVGAILAFAVRDAIPGVALGTIGYICMGAGVLSLVIGLVMYGRATSTRGTRVVERRDDVV
jgi:hypothetical protein